MKMPNKRSIRGVKIGRVASYKATPRTLRRFARHQARRSSPYISARRVRWFNPRFQLQHTGTALGLSILAAAGAATILRTIVEVLPLPFEPQLEVDTIRNSSIALLQIQGTLLAIAVALFVFVVTGLRRNNVLGAGIVATVVRQPYQQGFVVLVAISLFVTMSSLLVLPSWNSLVLSTALTIVSIAALLQVYGRNYGAIFARDNYDRLARRYLTTNLADSICAHDEIDYANAELARRKLHQEVSFVRHGRWTIGLELGLDYNEVTKGDQNEFRRQFLSFRIKRGNVLHQLVAQEDKYLVDIRARRLVRLLRSLLAQVLRDPRTKIEPILDKVGLKFEIYRPIGSYFRRGEPFASIDFWGIEVFPQGAITTDILKAIQAECVFHAASPTSTGVLDDLDRVAEMALYASGSHELEVVLDVLGDALADLYRYEVQMRSVPDNNRRIPTTHQHPTTSLMRIPMFGHVTDQMTRHLSGLAIADNIDRSRVVGAFARTLSYNVGVHSGVKSLASPRQSRATIFPGKRMSRGGAAVCPADYIDQVVRIACDTIRGSRKASYERQLSLTIALLSTIADYLVIRLLDKGNETITSVKGQSLYDNEVYRALVVTIAGFGALEFLRRDKGSASTRQTILGSQWRALARLARFVEDIVASNAKGGVSDSYVQFIDELLDAYDDLRTECITACLISALDIRESQRKNGLIVTTEHTVDTAPYIGTHLKAEYGRDGVRRSQYDIQKFEQWYSAAKESVELLGSTIEFSNQHNRRLKFENTAANLVGRLALV